MFLLSAGLAFGPAIDAPFDFDDRPAIVENTSIRALWPPSTPLQPPPLGTAVSGRPVVNYTFALNYALNRWLGVAQSQVQDAPSQSIGYHVVNIVLHVVAGLLLFALIRQTFAIGRVPDDWRGAGDRIAAIIAGLWLIHPIQTEAVDYVSQRTELLVSVCYLATLYASIRAWEASRDPRSTPRQAATVRWSVTAVVASLVGMASKEVMLTAPLVVLLYDRAFLASSFRDLWKTRSRRRLYAGLAATSIVSIVLIAQGGRSETVGFHLGVTWYEYFYSQAWAIAHYLRLILWPDGLTIDYGTHPVRGPAGIPGLLGLSLFAITAAAAWRHESWRWFGFLGVWFFFLLAPSSSIVPIQTEIAAERRIYLASAAVFTLIVIGAEQLRRYVDAKYGDRLTSSGRRWLTRGTLGAAGVAAVLLVAASFRRSSMYTDPIAIWRDAVVKIPGNARAYDNLAAATMRQEPDRLFEADSILQRAVTVDPAFVASWVRRAAIATKQRRLHDADTLLQQALRIAPDDSAATDKLGAVLLALGELDRALPYLRRLAEQFPSASSLANLGVAHLSAGRLDSATILLQRAVELDPTHVDALRYLGGALVEQDRGAAAVPYLVESARRQPDSGFTLGLLAVAYAQSGQADLAARAASEAVVKAPGDAAVLVFAGRGLQLAGRPAVAAQYLAEAVRLSPRDPYALTRLAIARASLGDEPTALRLLHRALALAPDYPLAQQSLADLKHLMPR